MGTERRLWLSRYDGPSHLKCGAEGTGRLKGGGGEWQFMEKAFLLENKRGTEAALITKPGELGSYLPECAASERILRNIEVVLDRE